MTDASNAGISETEKNKDEKTDKEDEKKEEEKSSWKSYFSKIGGILTLIYTGFYIINMVVGSIFKTYVLYQKMESEIKNLKEKNPPKNIDE